MEKLFATEAGLQAESQAVRPSVCLPTAAETEALAGETSLLPFEEIMGIFTQQVNRIYSYEEATGGRLTVTGVQLGLFRIREQGDMESGLLVPVWFITGKYCDAEHPEELYLKDEYDPIAVINAINGSIIDVNNGY